MVGSGAYRRYTCTSDTFGLKSSPPQVNSSVVPCEAGRMILSRCAVRIMGGMRGRIVRVRCGAAAVSAGPVRVTTLTPSTLHPTPGTLHPTPGRSPPHLGPPIVRVLMRVRFLQDERAARPQALDARHVAVAEHVFTRQPGPASAVKSPASSTGDSSGRPNLRPVM